MNISQAQVYGKAEAVLTGKGVVRRTKLSGMRAHLFSAAFAGSNLQALIDSTEHPKSSSHIVVVISNKAGVAGLDKAARAGIPTRVSRCGNALLQAAHKQGTCVMWDFPCVHAS